MLRTSRLPALLSALALLLTAAPAAWAQCTRTLNVSIEETSAGPYDPGDTFEATLSIWEPSGGETMGTSTVVIDFNSAALSYSSSPVASEDYEWLDYSGTVPVSGGTATYASEVRYTSASRITPFVYLASTTSPTGDGKAIPTAPTAVLSLQWTVVDPEAGIVVVPRSQQVFDGPGEPESCFDAGAVAGAEIGQGTVTGDRGWRMLSPPAPGFSIVDATAFNYVQGYPNIRVNQEPNLLVGYDGTDFVAPADPADDVPSGIGMYWFLYDQDFTRGPTTSVPLPMALSYSGASVLNMAPGGLLPDALAVPLHTDGNGWNLMGNPTATALDVTQLTPIGGSFATPIVQVWQDSPGTDGSGTYVLSTDPEIDGVIAPWQGFFLENLTATAVSIPSSARQTGGTLLKSGAPRAARRLAPEASIALRLEGEADQGGRLEDRAARLVLSPRALAGQDPLDVSKLTPLGQRFATLALVGEAGELRAQEARPLSREGVVVDLAFEAAGAAGEYTIHWGLASIPAGTSVRLLDRETGERVDLREVTSYTFRAGETRPAVREELARPRALTRSPLAPEATRFALAVGRSLPDAGPQTSKGADGLPEELGLEPARPNPFRTETTLRYGLPEAGHVRLHVFDLLGRTVARILDEERAAGYHSATFAPRDLAAGVYVVRLEIDGEVRTRRITVVR